MQTLAFSSLACHNTTQAFLEPFQGILDPPIQIYQNFKLLQTLPYTFELIRTLLLNNVIKPTFISLVQSLLVTLLNKWIVYKTEKIRV
jgi:hypothetical protein